MVLVISTLSTILAVVAIVAAAGAAVGCVLLWRQAAALRTTLGVLAEEVAAHASAPGSPGPPAVSAPRRLITVELLNPLEVAASQSRAAKLLGGLTPAVITKIVYDQASKQILTGLEEEGVAAEVRVHVAG